MPKGIYDRSKARKRGEGKKRSHHKMLVRKARVTEIERPPMVVEEPGVIDHFVSEYAPLKLDLVGVPDGTVAEAIARPGDTRPWRTIVFSTLTRNGLKDVRLHVGPVAMDDLVALINQSQVQ